MTSETSETPTARRASAVARYRARDASVRRFKRPQMSNSQERAAPSVVYEALVFTPTGTGVAPLRGMLQHLFADPSRKSLRHLIACPENPDKQKQRDQAEGYKPKQATQT